MENDEVEHYAENIKSDENGVPKFLILTYIILPIWGLFALYYYWNGSEGWLDRGYWKQLQRAANTTSPEINYTEFEAQKEKNKLRQE